jgi:hypothetical protein
MKEDIQAVLSSTPKNLHYPLTPFCLSNYISTPTFDLSHISKWVTTSRSPLHFLTRPTTDMGNLGSCVLARYNVSSGLLLPLPLPLHFPSQPVTPFYNLPERATCQTSTFSSSMKIHTLKSFIPPATLYRKQPFTNVKKTGVYPKPRYHHHLPHPLNPPHLDNFPYNSTHGQVEHHMNRRPNH